MYYQHLQTTLNGYEWRSEWGQGLYFFLLVMF